MIAVLFRWEIKPEYEQLFKEGWSEIMLRNIDKFGALGSRLHKAQNNQWFSYSQWISEAHFHNAFKLQDTHEAARMKMLKSINKSYDPIVMIPVLDHLMATKITQPQLLP